MIPPRRVLIAPQAFKGSADAEAVAAAIARGLRRVWPTTICDELPLADGGEGTVRALVRSTKGKLERTRVHDPLGRPVDAEWGLLGDGHTAVIEMAAASGLPLLAPSERDPRFTSTRGTGELLLEALRRGVRRVVIGIGGSATNDAGTGMARALGFRFLDANGDELPEGGAALARLARIEGKLDARLRSVEIRVACDVRNPLTGPNGASAVYGPQKGATPEMVAELDRALAHCADVVEPFVGRAVRDVPGAGAAGGLGAALVAFLGAELHSGADLVLDAARFDSRLNESDLVCTGEGRLDSQSLSGKLTGVVIDRAKRAGKPAMAIVGSLWEGGEGYEALYARGLGAIAVSTEGPATTEAVFGDAERLITDAAARLAKAVQLGAEVASVTDRE